MVDFCEDVCHIFHPAAFVAFAAIGDGGHIGRVRFEDQALQGDAVEVVAEFGVFEGNDAADTEVETHFNDLLGGSAGLVGFIILLVINCSLFAIDKWLTKENIYTKELSLE